MPKSQQKLTKIDIHLLKNLKDITIDFTEHPLTAILGPNGCGKSTILHAISCINNPVNTPYATINHRLSEFFTPTSHSVWTGSSFDVYQDFRDGSNVHSDHLTKFRKQRERWTPRYVTRIERYASFIGIRTCVPKIETETQLARIRFNTTRLNDNISNQVRQLAGEIMNRNYSEYNEHATRATKKYIGVSLNGVEYSSLSMGAGEQRIFHILSEVLKAPNYGMIIIDEIDLLLHQDALHRLLNVLSRIAIQKNLQIIFTTHALSILSLDFVAVRHLYQTPEKTLCFSQTKPDALHRLTGHQTRPLEIFVEDDLAQALVKKVASEEGLSKYVSINKFGAAINCFTSSCGAILNNLDNQENMLFVLDGDEYASEEQKREKIQRVLTGTTHLHVSQRELALNRITQFVIPNDRQPERYYHELICLLDDNDLNTENLEIVICARSIANPGDAHKYFDDLIARMDFTRDVGLNKLVDLLALSESWSVIKENIKIWLDGKRHVVIEQ